MTDSTTGWVKLFHPSGVQVSLPVFPTEVPSPEEWAKKSFDFVSTYIAAGFLVNAPGLEEGEKIEMITHVLRKETKEGMPLIALYSENSQLEWKVGHEYLDKDDEVDAFVKASGVKISELPLYEGGDYPKRNGDRLAVKYIRQVPRPFGYVWKPNPHYVPAPPEGQPDNRKPSQKRSKDFVRWQHPKDRGIALPPQPTATSAEIEYEVNWWKKFIANDPSFDSVNDNIKQTLLNKPAAVINAVIKNVLNEWKTLVGAEWDKDNKRYVRPKPPEDELGGEYDYANPPAEHNPF